MGIVWTKEDKDLLNSPSWPHASRLQMLGCKLKLQLQLRHYSIVRPLASQMAKYSGSGLLTQSTPPTFSETLCPPYGYSRVPSRPRFCVTQSPMWWHRTERVSVSDKSPPY
ncbi:hypothetical protein MN608_07355 [Microdochium nivale]|nr:hypothetical protein MN608_07355 [Microdochium nivale]